jgi:hypothetical protein
MKRTLQVQDTFKATKEPLVYIPNYTVYQLPITKWPHQSEAPVGAAPPTRSQRKLKLMLKLKTAATIKKRYTNPPT